MLYDVTSSYYEGKTCPLARFGHDRDGKTGCPIIVYGMLTDAEGRPVAVRGLSRQHRRPHDRPRSGRGAHEAVRPVAGGAGRRSRHAHANADRRAQETPGPGLDLGVAERVDPPPAGRRPPVSSRSGGRTPGGDHLPGLPRRTAGGLLQPATGRAASAEAAGPARRHPGRIGGTGRERGRAPADPPETAAEIGVRAGKIINHYKMAKHFTLTIRDGHLGWARKEEAIAERRAAGWDLCDPDQRADRAVDGRRRGAVVQAAGVGGAGVPVSQGDRPAGAADPPPHGRPGAGAHPAVPAGLLRGVAPAPGVGAAAVRGRGTGPGPARSATRSSRPGPPPPPRPRRPDRQTDDGLEVHSFRTLLADLATRCRNRCRFPAAPGGEGSAAGTGTGGDRDRHDRRADPSHEATGGLFPIPQTLNSPSLHISKELCFSSNPTSD